MKIDKILGLWVGRKEMGWTYEKIPREKEEKREKARWKVTHNRDQVKRKEESLKCKRCWRDTSKENDIKTIH